MQQLILNIDGVTCNAAEVYNDLPRAVLISLFSWRRANPDDDLPGSEKMGWWGDTYPEIANDRIGSRLWLLSRAKLTVETVLRAKEYAEESLQWLIEDGVAADVQVQTERQGLDRLALGIQIMRGDRSALNIRFANVWDIFNVIAQPAIPVISPPAVDIIPPSVPANLTISVISSSEIDIEWDASTDDTGVAGYGIWINDVFSGLSIDNNFQAVGLMADTLYSFQVDARDAAGNISEKSAAVSDTTATATEDVTPPSVPDNLTITVVSSSQIYLEWADSTDDVGVVSYGIWMNGGFRGLRTLANYLATGLTANTLYNFQVDARDAAGNISAKSALVSATTEAGVAAGFYGDWETGLLTGSGNHNWLQSAIDSGSSIEILSDSGARQGSKYARVTLVNGQAQVSHCQDENDDYLWEETGTIQYTYSIKLPEDWRTNRLWCAVLCCNAPHSLVTLPAWALFVSQDMSGFENRYSLSYYGGDIDSNASRDAVLSESALNIGAWTDFIITVKYSETPDGFITVQRRDENDAAFSEVLNLQGISTVVWSSSRPSGQAWNDHQYISMGLFRDTAEDGITDIIYNDGFTRTVVTPSEDVTPPSVPINVLLTVISSSEIDVAWDASTDDVGVTAYGIWRDGVFIGTTAATSYSAIGLEADTEYSFQIDARDAAGNISEKSAAVSDTTETNADVSFFGDWESGLVTGSGDHNWKLSVIGSGSSIAILTDAGARQGSKYARFTVINGRAEVTNCQDADSNYVWEESGTIRYTYSVKLPIGWRTNRSWCAVLQCHSPDSFGTTPAWALLPSQQMSGFQNCWSLGYMGGDLDVEISHDIVLSNATLNIGYWTDFIITVKYSTTHDGFITIQRRDEGESAFTEVLNLQNIATVCWSTSRPSGIEWWDHQYMRMGLYRDSSEDGIIDILYNDGFTRTVIA